MGPAAREYLQQDIERIDKRIVSAEESLAEALKRLAEADKEVDDWHVAIESMRNVEAQLRELLG